MKALNINKIEARLDSDPEVKRYVHNREYEKIVVEPTSEINSVNYLFGKLLDPLLEMLRSRNGIRNFRGSNSTITSYNLLLAMKELNDRGDYSLNHIYSIVQSLLRAREGLRENGEMNSFMSIIIIVFYIFDCLHEVLFCIRYGIC